MVEATREKSFGYSQSVSQLGAVAFTDRSHIELPEALEFTYKVKRWQADARGCCPVLQSRINVQKTSHVMAHQLATIWAVHLGPSEVRTFPYQSYL